MGEKKCSLLTPLLGTGDQDCLTACLRASLWVMFLTLTKKLPFIVLNEFFHIKVIYSPIKEAE